MPSRLSKAPRSGEPTGAASYSCRMRSFSAAVRERRSGLGWYSGEEVSGWCDATPLVVDDTCLVMVSLPRPQTLNSTGDLSHWILTQRGSGVTFGQVAGVQRIRAAPFCACVCGQPAQSTRWPFHEHGALDAQSSR